MTETNTTPPLPEKPAHQSVSMWAAVVTFLAGFATQFGLSAEFAEFIGANVEQVVGAIMSLFGVVMAYGTMRRNSKIKM
jgi:small neutral amino acid transporter SnatA (MarC family)